MSLGFKELASVCQAIASGRQSLLLRKAGLRESTAESGFQTRHFYLLPTRYHEKKDKASGDGFQIRLRVEVIQSGDLLEWSGIEKLLPLTAYDPATLRQHFESRDQKLLHFAHIRAFLLQPEWHLPPSPSLSGCRSWFELPNPPAGLSETPIPATETSRRTAELLV
ncbi:MAG: DUF1802 family protein [Verrucomicrobia bacterium]|nr:DUF1802 family protein [Verrucomicrobiota bacterium]